MMRKPPKTFMDNYIVPNDTDTDIFLVFLSFRLKGVAKRSHNDLTLSAPCLRFTGG